jgi:diguanylate cyclase (GGDEF)-like protein
VEIRQLNTRLEFLAMTDDLTGLTNRRSFIAQGIKEINRAQRSHAPMCLYLLDLDGFKEINDRDGHEAGDKALQCIAAVLLDTIRKTDLLARLGGDELRARRTPKPMMCLSWLEPRHAVEKKGSPTKTMHVNGITSYRLEDPSFYAVIRRADAAMYQAKSQGGNRVVCVE